MTKPERQSLEEIARMATFKIASEIVAVYSRPNIGSEHIELVILSALNRAVKPYRDALESLIEPFGGRFTFETKVCGLIVNESDLLKAKELLTKGNKP